MVKWDLYSHNIYIYIYIYIFVIRLIYLKNKNIKKCDKSIKKNVWYKKKKLLILSFYKKTT